MKKRRNGLRFHLWILSEFFFSSALFLLHHFGNFDLNKKKIKSYTEIYIIKKKKKKKKKEEKRDKIKEKIKNKTNIK